MLYPIKCKNTDPYVIRPLAGEFTWLVYNTHSGYIVASTHCKHMAEIIRDAIHDDPTYNDVYGITQMWDE